MSPKKIELPLLDEDVVGREEEIVDGRVAHGGDADAFTRLDKFVNDVRTAVGLAGARRSLHGHVAVIEMTNPRERGRQIIGENSLRRSVAGLKAGALTSQQRPRHSTGGIRVVWRHYLFGEMEQNTRLLLRPDVIVDADN